jgi:NADH-quinone oxidoreductase subunit M
MNQAGFPLLSLLTFLPLVGCLVILTVRGDEATVASNARWAALWTSLIVFVLSLVLWFEFDRGQAGFQFTERLSCCRPMASITVWASTASAYCSC